MEKSVERIDQEIRDALNLLQIITEDIEENLHGDHVSNWMRARVELTISSLYVLRRYLESICKEDGNDGQAEK